MRSYRSVIRPPQLWDNPQSHIDFSGLNQDITSDDDFLSLRLSTDCPLERAIAPYVSKGWSLREGIRNLGHIYEEWFIEQELVNKGCEVQRQVKVPWAHGTGHIDVWNVTDGDVIDVKTTSSKPSERPPKDAFRQVARYHYWSRDFVDAERWGVVMIYKSGLDSGVISDIFSIPDLDEALVYAEEDAETTDMFVANIEDVVTNTEAWAEKCTCAKHNPLAIMN